jgi:hypothetical protein
VVEPELLAPLPPLLLPHAARPATSKPVAMIADIRFKSLAPFNS